MAKKKTTAGPNKYAAVKQLIKAEPNISQSDLISRLKSEGIDISEATASNYRSTARKELGISKPRKGKRRKAKAMATAKAMAPASVNGSPAHKPSHGGAEDFITLAGLVKKIGADEIHRFVKAIS